MQNITVSQIISMYGTSFFMESYGIPQNRLYDFILFCAETSSLQSDFKKENYASVLTIFSEKSKEYVKRITEKE